MPTLQAVYMMAFTPEKMDNGMLMAVCQMAADRLAAKSPAFAQRMNLLSKDTRMNMSNQLYAENMHTPQNMQLTLEGWLHNNQVVTDMRFGDNFFPHGMRDPKGRENFFLYYFDLK